MQSQIFWRSCTVLRVRGLKNIRRIDKNDVDRYYQTSRDDFSNFQPDRNIQWANQVYLPQQDKKITSGSVKIFQNGAKILQKGRLLLFEGKNSEEERIKSRKSSEGRNNSLHGLGIHKAQKHMVRKTVILVRSVELVGYDGDIGLPH